MKDNASIGAKIKVGAGKQFIVSKNQSSLNLTKAEILFVRLSATLPWLARNEEKIIALAGLTLIVALYFAFQKTMELVSIIH